MLTEKKYVSIIVPNLLSLISPCLVDMHRFGEEIIFLFLLIWWYRNKHFHFLLFFTLWVLSAAKIYLLPVIFLFANLRLRIYALVTNARTHTQSPRVLRILHSSEKREKEDCMQDMQWHRDSRHCQCCELFLKFPVNMFVFEKYGIMRTDTQINVVKNNGQLTYFCCVKKHKSKNQWIT